MTPRAASDKARMSGGSPRIAVVVPAKNEERFIDLCLDSIQSQEVEVEFEVVVVDNGSTDATIEKARRHGVKVLTSSASTPAAVRNEGVAVCSSTVEVYAFIDGDCVAPADWLGSVWSGFTEGTDRIALGGGCISPVNANWVVKAWTPPVGAGVGRNLCAANMSVSAGVFSQIGGFDDRLTSAEDDDISVRLREIGTVDVGHLPVVEHWGYPDSMGAVFRKARWHGSTQLRASGWYRDSMVLLTLVWGVTWLAALTAAALGEINGAIVAATIAAIALPSVLAWRRLRATSWTYVRRFGGLTLVLANTVLIGRLVGLVSETLRR